MISLNRSFVFKLKILLLSGSMLNSFNFTDQIYLPQICLYINEYDEYEGFQPIEEFNIFKQEGGKSKVFKINEFCDSYHEPLYDISIQNIKNESNTTFGKNILLGTALWAFLVDKIIESSSSLKDSDYAGLFIYGGIYGWPASMYLISLGDLEREFVKSEYEIKNNLQKQEYFNIKLKQKQRLHSDTYDPSLININNKQAVRIPNNKISWNKLIELMVEPNQIKKYKKIYDEVQNYNVFYPDYYDIDAWKAVKLQKYGAVKGEFEKTYEYRKRLEYEEKMIQKINTEYKAKKDAILSDFNNKKQKKFDNLMEKIIKFKGVYSLHEIKLSNYDADNETFTVTSPTYPIEQKIEVKRNVALNFKKEYLDDLVLKTRFKPLVSTKSKFAPNWIQQEEIILINLKTNKQIPFLSENSIFEYKIGKK